MNLVGAGCALARPSRHWSLAISDHQPLLPGLDMGFPKVDLRNDAACFRALVDLIHGDGGFPCPYCHERDGVELHQKNDKPWCYRYRRAHCRKYFSVWTKTPL